jgi:hypothetical protein
LPVVDRRSLALDLLILQPLLIGNDLKLESQR